MNQQMTYQQLVGHVSVLMNTGQFQEATRLLKMAVRQSPDVAHLHFLLALAYEAAQLTPQAVRQIRQAITIASHIVDYHKAHARMLVSLERLDDAEKAYDRAIELQPGDDDAIGQKAELHALRQQFDDAKALMAPYLEQEQPPLGVIMAHAKMADRIDDVDRAIGMLESVVADESVNATVRGRMGFQLGRLLDRKGEYDRAFPVFERANSLLALPHDRTALDREIDELIEGWSAERYANLPRTGFSSNRPIFIIGVPRSGSTLTEQILSSHSQVAGAGEWFAFPQSVIKLHTRMKITVQEKWKALDRLTVDLLKEHARAYLAEGRDIDKDAKFLTDKMLANFRHLGYISLMFPKAPIVVCWRDPFDAVLSMYFQDFSQGVTYAHDLRDAAHHYAVFCRVVRHWEGIIPNPVLHVQYEDIVADLEGQAHRLIDFVGLKWEDACLEFHRNARITVTASAQQVRRPIYKSSVRRHEKYASHIGPIREILEQYGCLPEGG